MEVNSETVKEIIIENNDRVSKLTIINFSKINVGDDIDDNSLNAIIKNLYETNFFDDVSAKIIDNKLTITVKENKIIQSVLVNGIKAKKFKEAILNEIKLVAKTPYNKFLASKDLVLIKNVLISQGFYFSNVTSSIIENENGTLNLIYDVEMGKKSLVKTIEFTGDKVFKSRKLRNIITSEENKFWKFISNKKFLNKDQLALDERLLKRFYLNRGYYNVKVSSVFAKLLDDGNFKIVYNINAGNIYKINKTTLALPTDYDVDNFQEIKDSLIKIEGSKYSFLKINKIVDEIDKISLDKEYEFINASINEETLDDNLIDLTILISESKKEYVERINIFGNDITQENVIRSELRVNEGDAYNELLHSKSLNNLKALNIFKDVTVVSSEGSSVQQKILDINVEEKPTGEISLGAGFGTSGGTLGFSVSENNYMGKGIKIRSSLKVSSDTIRGQFSVLNPNFKYSNKSLFTNIESSSTDKLTTSGYKSNKTGFSIGTKFEQYEAFYFSPAIDVYQENLTTNSAASKALKKQNGSSFSSNFKYGLDYDRRNQRYMTTEGFRSNFSQSIPLISDVFAVGNTYLWENYFMLPNDMVTKFSLYGAAINSLSDKDVKISDRLSLPSDKLKGFTAGRVGPKDNGDYVGGNYASSMNISTTLPMFFQSLENTDISYFIDFGNVWGVDYSSAVGNSSLIRSSTGVVINWFTPIGPLNFSFAKPLRKVTTDQTEGFQFNLGTTF